MAKRGGAWITAALLAAGCAKPPPPDIPVGPLGFAFEVDADRINSFVCAREKHFSIAYLPSGIFFSTGIGGPLPMKIVGAQTGVRYDGGNFTIVTTGSRAVVYYDSQPVMTDCTAIMQ